ncbi:MAG: glycosyltransferase, partial [Bdellovibrionales bacterium]|nr:glycosyltransferase [Bdellovibrionales bacterium]
MKKIVVIAGGGTGGHIYPALAIAEALKIKDSEVEIHFVGTGQGLEAKIIPSYGYPLHFVPVGMLNSNVNLVTRIKTLLLLPFAFLKALWLVFKLKPNLVLGVGGYASAPMVFLSSLLRKKTYLWEPNAYPGLANRYLSKWVDASLVVFESAKEYLQSKNFYKVGLPVRKEIESLAKKDVALSKDDAFKILIFGGSQGALRINEVFCE